METGGGKWWLRMSWDCGFGATEQFLKGLDCCTKEGGLPSHGERRRQFRKNILVFRYCVGRERGSRFAVGTTCILAVLGWTKPRRDEVRLALGRKREVSLTTQLLTKFLSRCLAKIGNNISGHLLCVTCPIHANHFKLVLTLTIITAIYRWGKWGEERFQVRKWGSQDSKERRALSLDTHQIHCSQRRRYDISGKEMRSWV